MLPSTFPEYFFVFRSTPNQVITDYLARGQNEAANYKFRAKSCTYISPGGRKKKKCDNINPGVK